MSPQAIPADVRRFIHERIDSVEQLEMLLLLQGAPERWWSADTVAAELRTDPRSSAVRLEDLSSRKLLDVRLADAVLFRYAPLTPELDALVQALARIYRERRLDVTAVIYGAPADRIRGFADAFRIRKEDDHG